MGMLDLASLCAGYGLKSAIGGHQLITTLSISLVWIIYSAIPPLLLVVYRFLGRGSFLSWLCWLCFLVSSACGFLAILLLWNVYPAEVRLKCLGCLTFAKPTLSRRSLGKAAYGSSSSSSSAIIFVV